MNDNSLRQDLVPGVFLQVSHTVDFCVIGGGMAGLCAAVAAARRGARVVLMHDRPVFGGNASSECRVHICGADRHNHIKNMRETGILEEIRLENLRRNPNRNFSVWDTVLYNTVISEPNITPLLNCSCLDAVMDGQTISSVSGWQTTTQTLHHVTARIFADCSGDAILAPLTGADHGTGREGRDEYGESIAPPQADACTMGMTCLFQSRQYDTPQVFEPPAWALCFDTCEELPYGARGHRWWQMGYWWIELGGEYDTIRDAELLRHELLKTTYGVWDHIKNRCANRHEAENWAIEWIQFLPAKRESRRYLGAHVLTQNDIEAEGRFDDLVAYGGWSMDDHHPAGFNAVKLGVPATIFHAAPSPFGIPYRSLYSRNVANLMFAGRNASCTHAAMSSTRVMGTGCCMGQAVGTAAALALAGGCGPAAMLDRVADLQQALIEDDAYLPHVKQLYSDAILHAALTSSSGDPQPLRDGINRPVGDDPHAWACGVGESVVYEFETKTAIDRVTVVLDSGLDQNVALSYHQHDNQLIAPPAVLPKAFRIDVRDGDTWQEWVNVTGNYQRQRRFAVNRDVTGIRFTLVQTWGAETSRLYAFYAE